MINQIEQLQAQLQDAYAVIDSYAEQMIIMSNGNVRKGAEYRKHIAQLDVRIRELEVQLSAPQLPASQPGGSAEAHANEATT